MVGADPKSPVANAVATVAAPRSLGQEAVSSFRRALDQALARPEVRVVVVRGDAQGFCGGMDLSEISETSSNPEGHGELRQSATQDFVELLETLLYATPITVAVVEGPAMGGGVGLLAACDLVLATEQASFALPELLLGLVPAMILPVLAERLGLHQAKRWAIAQATWQAVEANHRGLVDQLVSVERLDAELKRTMRSLLRVHPRGVTALKRFARQIEHRELSVAMRKGQALLVSLLDQTEVRAEVVAFRDYGILPGSAEI
jgi:enoyl-CoA hydratase/carnithine racemase